MRNAPTRSYLICYSPRSGSTLLADGLANTDLAGHPEEYFNSIDATAPGQVALQEPVWEQEKRALPFLDYLERVRQYGTTPNGIFGLKLDWWHFSALRQNMGTSDLPAEQVARRLREMFPNPRFIWVTRRDKVRQAVSLYRAQQSDIWMESGHGVRPELQFKLRNIRWAIRGLVWEEAYWSDFFTGAGIAPYTVVYEDLVMRYDATVREVLQFLDLSLPAGASLPPPRLRKQADDLSEAWVRRYYREQQARSEARWFVDRQVRRIRDLVRRGI